MASKLAAGANFPPMKLNVVVGDMITLPDDSGAAYQIVLFYRGHW